MKSHSLKHFTRRRWTKDQTKQTELGFRKGVLANRASSGMTQLATGEGTGFGNRRSLNSLTCTIAHCSRSLTHPPNPPAHLKRAGSSSLGVAHSLTHSLPNTSHRKTSH